MAQVNCQESKDHRPALSLLQSQGRESPMYNVYSLFAQCQKPWGRGLQDQRACVPLIRSSVPWPKEDSLYKLHAGCSL